MREEVLKYRCDREAATRTVSRSLIITCDQQGQVSELVPPALIWQTNHPRGPLSTEKFADRLSCRRRSQNGHLRLPARRSRASRIASPRALPLCCLQAAARSVVPPSRTAGRQAARPRLAAPSARSRLPLLVGNGRPIEKVPWAPYAPTSGPGQRPLACDQGERAFLRSGHSFPRQSPYGCRFLSCQLSAVSFQQSAPMEGIVKLPS